MDDPSYRIMTINMAGQSKKTDENTDISPPRDDRVLLAKTIIKNYSPSIIFCQEIPGHSVQRDFVDVIGTQELKYSHTKNKPEAAVLWRTKDFHGTTAGLETSDTTITAIRDKVKKTYDACDLLSIARIAMVKLTPCNSDVFSVLAVSWHGPHTGCTDKNRVFYGLIAFLKRVCKKEKIPSFIIGGDFNLNTVEVQLDENVEQNLNVVRRSYELSTRQPVKKTNHGNYIPHKDNFIIYSKPDRKLKLTKIKPFKIEEPEAEDEPSGSSTSSIRTIRDSLSKDDYASVQSKLTNKEWKVEELLDHDPILGVLQFGISKEELLADQLKKLTVGESTSNDKLPAELRLQET
ncbi:hypothetical protein QZH41_002218 [Actinostola sp. cb2023]|nr:hypothetical protein QZH41_002218 [Actinostola sp. cb2023]